MLKKGNCFGCFWFVFNLFVWVVLVYGYLFILYGNCFCEIVINLNMWFVCVIKWNYIIVFDFKFFFLKWKIFIKVDINL